MAGANYGHYFFIEGQPKLGVGRDPVITARHVSADYFRTMQIPVRRGRAFTESDSEQSQPVAIINERAARMFFPNSDPIGQRLANSRDGLMREIVGIVGDVRFEGPTHGIPPELYVPYRQIPWPTMTLVASSALPDDVVAGAIRRSVQQIDREQAVAEIRSMQRVVAATTTQHQFTTSLLGTFASVATALAAIGLYGVVAVFVGQRRQEFGIRMALGAQRHDVLRLVMRHALIVIGSGTVVGLLGAIALTRLLRSLLFRVTPTEPISFVVGAAVLLATGLLACYMPARRAMTVDPAKTLRAE
jgi:predicted permease